MNRNYFCRFFKEKVGKTPFSYLNEYRVNQAASQLLSTRLPITEIALNAGFENMSYFIRQFRALQRLYPFRLPEYRRPQVSADSVLTFCTCFSVRQPPVFLCGLPTGTQSQITRLSQWKSRTVPPDTVQSQGSVARIIASGIRAPVNIILITLQGGLSQSGKCSHRRCLDT